MLKKKKINTRIGNRALKKEYEKGFAAGENHAKAAFDAVREFLRSNISQQVIDAVDAGVKVDITINTTGDKVLNILRKII